jgi:hypothetical protein
MTDWSQFKPADEPVSGSDVDWSQFKPEPAKPSLLDRARALFSSSDIPASDPMGTGSAEIMAQPTADTRPVLDRPATPEQVSERPKGFSPQEMADGSVAPWKSAQADAIAAYGNTNRSPDLKAPGQSKIGDMLRGLDRKPFDNSLVGAVAETAGDAGRGLAKVVPSLAKSGYGLLQAGAEVVGADGVSSFARSAQDAGADWLAQFDNPNGDSLVTGAFQSLGTAIAGGAVAGTSGAIALAVGQTGADKFNELRKGGVGLTDALEGATVHGVAEYLGERIGMKSLGRMVSGIASKTGMPPMAALKEFLKQQGEEQVTLAIQSAYDKLGSGSLRNDMTMDDYLNDVVTTVQQTAIMTAAAAGGGRIARAASVGAQQMLTPGLAARVEPKTEPFEAGFTPMTDSANIAPAAPVAPSPTTLTAVRVEDQPTTPMTPEEILSVPVPKVEQAKPDRVDVNNADAVLAQLGLGQPAESAQAPVTQAIEPAFQTQTAAAIAARRDGGEVVPVPGGFAVQPITQQPITQQPNAETLAIKSDSGSATPEPVVSAPVAESVAPDDWRATATQLAVDKFDADVKQSIENSAPVVDEKLHRNDIAGWGRVVQRDVSGWGLVDNDMDRISRVTLIKGSTLANFYYRKGDAVDQARATAAAETWAFGRSANATKAKAARASTATAETAANVSASRFAPMEAARKPSQKSPDVAVQVDLRKRVSVLQSLLECMA